MWCVPQTYPLIVFSALTQYICDSTSCLIHLCPLCKKKQTKKTKSLAVRWVKRKRKRACQLSRTCARWLARGADISPGLPASSLRSQLCKRAFFEHPNRLVMRTALDHPVANQRGPMAWKAVINPLNSRLKYLCCHRAIYSLYSRFRNQSDTSVQSNGW